MTMYRSGGQVKEIYEKLFRLLSDRNEKINLTAIKSKEDFEVKHVRDSMLGLPYINGKVLDVGSGAGFPGLVIKIEKPETVVTLIDSVRKKTDYLSEAIKELGLENITAVHTRIEDMAGKESYDTVTARAVARMATLAEYCLPFVKTGGAFVAYKSEGGEEELNEAEKVIRLLGGKVERDELLSLDEDTKRRIIVIRKVRPSPAGYPRSGNKPRLKPIM